jgi:choline dehydrogenase
MKPILIGNEVAPGQSVQSDEELNQYIQNNFFMNWHAACTCRMGRINDTMAIVNSKARLLVCMG